MVTGDIVVTTKAGKIVVGKVLCKRNNGYLLALETGGTVWKKSGLNPIRKLDSLQRIGLTLQRNYDTSITGKESIDD